MPGDGPTLVRMPEQQSPISGGVVARFALYCVLAGVLVAGLLFPVVGGAGLLANQAADVGAQDSAQVVQGDMPIVSTMVDAWPAIRLPGCTPSAAGRYPATGLQTR